MNCLTHSPRPHSLPIGRADVRPTLLAALAALLSLAALPPAAAAPNNNQPPPVRQLSTVETAVADGLPSLFGSALALKVASMVRASAYNKGNPKLAVQRPASGNAASYAGLPAASPPLLPTWPAGASLFDFTVTGDAAQSWATMTADGVPYLFVRGFGEFSAEATASWTSTVTLPASSKEVVLRLVIPPASVGGDTEDDARAWWRSQLRAELMVNGYPAWSSEALRLRADYKNSASSNNTLEVLQQFGQPLPFATDDEDGNSANDSRDGNLDTPSARKVVYLSLGRFDANAQLHLAMVWRGRALTVPETAGGTDHRCKSTAAQYFCSRGSMSLQGAPNDGPRVIFFP